MNTKEEVSYWDKILDTYEDSIGIPKYESEAFSESELQNYLTMNRNVIEKLSPEDCAK